MLEKKLELFIAVTAVKARGVTFRNNASNEKVFILELHWGVLRLHYEDFSI